MKPGPKPTDPIARFWAKVDRSGECWLWTGPLDASGRGRLWVDGKDVLAHRFAWEMEYGPIPEGMCVCHHCDTPHCVNVRRHAFLGTQADNTADKMNKGRYVRVVGEENPSAKLTAEQVGAIRSRYRAGGIKQKELAVEYGVRQTLISQIVLGQIWKEVQV